MPDNDEKLTQPLTAEEIFAVNLKALRTDRGMTQSELARHMSEKGFKWHQATVFKLENGERQIQLGELREISTLFNVALDRLVEGTDRIAELSKLRQDVDQLEKIRLRLIENANAYDGLRLSVRARAGIDPDPWDTGDGNLKTLLSADELEAIERATDEDVDDVMRNRMPF